VRCHRMGVDGFAKSTLASLERRISIMDPQPPGGSGYTPPPLPPPPPVYAGPPASAASFSFGDILGQTFSVYTANFIAFVTITALVSIPAIAVLLLMGSNPFGVVIATLLGAFTGPISTAAITYGVYEYLRGRQTTVGECLRVGLANIGPVFVVALLVGLITLGGMILCIIPGFIAMTVYSVAVPVAIQEKLGGMDALRRSSTLTEGHRWDVFGVLFVIGLLGGGIGFVIGIIAASIGQGQNAQLFGQILGILVGGLNATAPAVMYYGLRRVKESIDVRDIASVFD
jgi:uncharacterized membrane protein